MVKTFFFLGVITCLSSGLNVDSDQKKERFMTKNSERLRQLTAPNDDPEGVPVYPIPPAEVHWVAGNVSNISITYDLPSASQENDTFTITFPHRVACGNPSLPKIESMVFMFDSNFPIGDGLFPREVENNMRIALGFTPDGKLFDVIYPVSEPAINLGQAVPERSSDELNK